MNIFKKLKDIVKIAKPLNIFKSKVFTKSFYRYMLIILIISLPFYPIYKKMFQLVKTSNINDSASVLSE